MTDKDLANAIHFLRRIAVGRLDEQRLIDTIDALQDELEKRRRDRQQRHDR